MLLTAIGSFFSMLLSDWPDPYIVSSLHQGPVFDGIGAISGGGATSKLLFSQTKQQRAEIMKMLFKPPWGVQILKVEMGGDDQSTEGAEASHQTERGRSHYDRGYEWTLMQEALEINPNLSICVLPWAFPGWLGNGTSDPFFDYQQTAEYVVSWLEGARKIYNIRVDCVGIWNERPWQEEYVEVLRTVLDDKDFKHVRIVVGDNFKTSDEAFDRMLRPGFVNKYDIIGVHYPGGELPEAVRQSGKTLWASEDFSTATNRETDGFGCLARTINRNYVTGNMTATLVWHLVSAFYPDMPYFGASLATFDGRVTPAFQAMAMTTAFTGRGWRILKQGYGSGLLRGGGSYVAYTNGTDLSIVVETMSYNRSLCMYSNPPYYTVEAAQPFSIKLEGSFAKLNVMNLYYSNYMRQPQQITGSHGGYFDVGGIRSDMVYIITTLTVPFPMFSEESEAEVTGVPEKPPTMSNGGGGSSPNYVDNFTDYRVGSEPRWLSPQKGAWEVADGRLSQVVTSPPIAWCAADMTTPLAVMPGSSLRVDVSLPLASAAAGIFVGLRSNCSGCKLSECTGVFVTLSTNTTMAHVFYSLKSLVANEPVLTIDTRNPWNHDYWRTVRLQEIQNEHFMQLEFGDFQIEIDLPHGVPVKGPFVVIGSTSFGISNWDNLALRGFRP